MAEIHHTTMAPGKLELLTSWLPGQPWFSGADPALTKAGGFRLDDPAGEVGIEVMIVADNSGDAVVHYVVPLSYRDAPSAGAGDALIGTSEHGVLGTRWIYDGARDPVVLAQLSALIAGEVEAQSQNVSFAPDPTVITRASAATESTRPESDNGTSPEADDAGGSRPSANGNVTGPASVTIVRVPTPNGEVPSTGGYIQAEWTGPDGSNIRAVVVQTP